MFWNRAAREARRQKVLEDLIDLTPEERLLRMDRAVADGDVRAEEVDQAIRLVGRLDALRVMTIPGPRGAATATDVAKPDQLPEPSESVTTTTPRKLSRRARRRAAIAVTPELIEASRRAAVAPIRHSNARDAAVRKANRAIGSPRRRRLRFAAALAAMNPAALPAPITAPADASEASEVAFAMAAVADTRQEEQWPNIAWLRP